jgi:dolichol-phosphate mannosyltransferase
MTSVPPRLPAYSRVANGSDHLAGEPLQICVLVLTRNEAGNVRPLVTRLAAALHDVPAEILFVDDSSDETPDVVSSIAAAAPLPVRLLHRTGPDRTGGLGGAVVAGLDATDAPWVVVMDGDLQHPPELLPALVDRAGSGAYDLVVASRYEGAGSAEGLSSGLRVAVSRSATAAAKVLFPRRLAAVSDPMTGFFAVRREALELEGMRPRGFKILLEILTRTPRLRVAEVPFTFGVRASGESKAGGREGLRYLVQLVSLRLAAVRELADLLRFALVGASGVLVNLLALAAVLEVVPRPVTGGVQAAAETAATQAAVLWNFTLTELWVFRGRASGRGRVLRCAGYWAISIAALAVQLPLAAGLDRLLPFGYVVATGLALVALVVGRYAVCSVALYGRRVAVIETPASAPEGGGRRGGMDTGGAA